MVKGARLRVATPEPGGARDLVTENVPGGWGTIAVVGLIGVFLLMGAMRPRRA